MAFKWYTLYAASLSISPVPPTESILRHPMDFTCICNIIPAQSVTSWSNSHLSYFEVSCNSIAGVGSLLASSSYLAALSASFTPGAWLVASFS